MFHFIHPQNGLPESIAIKFFYQTILAIEHIHLKQIAHRDIKPENILLDKDFNIKLCDFGWANYMNTPEPRMSICGTFEYMPPEVANNCIHTVSADIWSLGILLYEMLHGKAPFSAHSLQDIKTKISSQMIQINASLSSSTKELIKLLLKKDFQKRATATEIKNLMEQSFLENILKDPVNEKQKFLLFKNFFFNKFKITDEKLIQQKIIENSFDDKEKEESLKMPLKYNRLYNLHTDLAKRVEISGKIFLFRLINSKKTISKILTILQEIHKSEINSKDLVVTNYLSL